MAGTEAGITGKYRITNKCTLITSSLLRTGLLPPTSSSCLRLYSFLPHPQETMARPVLTTHTGNVSFSCFGVCYVSYDVSINSWSLHYIWAQNDHHQETKKTEGDRLYRTGPLTRNYPIRIRGSIFTRTIRRNLGQEMGLK